MRKGLFLLLFGVVLSGFAQTDSSGAAKADTLWEKGGTFNINFNQANLTNWAAGGESSISIGGVLNVFANYEKGKLTWKNSLQWTYGQSKIGGGDNLFKKTDDQFILISKFAYGVKEKKIKWSGVVDFRTQIVAGYNYVEDSTAAAGERKGDAISKFLAPGYLVTSLGWEYSPKKDFFLMLSALTGKTTIVTDKDLSAVGAFGVDSNSTVRFELGSYLKMGYKLPIMENVTFNNNLSLFTAYDSFGKIDVNWETVTVFKINKVLSTSFTTQMIYDEDVDVERVDGTVGPATQFKYVLNIGVMLSF